MPNRHLAALLSLLTLAAACGGSGTAPTSATPTRSDPPAPAPAPEPVASADPAPSASAPPPEPAKPPPPTPAMRATGFSTPESVLWDEARDRYLVSNIDGKPADADGKGFISDLSPDGAVTNLRWIESGKNKVTLNAPKGTAIVKDVLYVADLDTVRTFDVKSGAPKGEIKLPGATFANDVAGAADGRVFVSDTGIKFGASGPEPTGTDAVWVIEKGKAKTLAKSPDLAWPNGLLADGKTVIVAPFGGSELYRIDEAGKRIDMTPVGKGMLDGLARAGDTLLVSSWEASGIFRGKVAGTFTPVLEQLSSPADIGYDQKRNRVLVPRFTENAVEAYDLK